MLVNIIIKKNYHNNNKRRKIYADRCYYYIIIIIQGALRFILKGLQNGLIYRRDIVEKKRRELEEMRGRKIEYK